METLQARYTGWITALQPGSHSLPATILLTGLSVYATWWAAPFFVFLLGAGWAAPLVTAVSLFLILLLFRKILLRHIYNPPAEAD